MRSERCETYLRLVGFVPYCSCFERGIYRFVQGHELFDLGDDNALIGDCKRVG